MGETAGAAGDGQYVDYDPGPDRPMLAARHGIELQQGQARTLQRLEADFGTERVSRWADEGMPVEAMGKPREMAAFRKRQAESPEEVPTDVERRNEASLQRNAAGSRDDGPAGEMGVPAVVASGGGVIERSGRGLFVQPKLEVGSPADPAEREAEEVAKRVVEMDVPAEQALEVGRDGRRESEAAVTPSESVSRSVGDGELSSEAEQVVRRGVRGGGKPLPTRTRSEFESKMGADFSDVRVHTGSDADDAARSIDAEAYTMGSDIAFAARNYQPESNSGRRLLAHELAHVVQQEDSRSINRQEQSPDEDDTADGGGSGGNAAIVSAAESRAKGDIGDAYDWTPGWWYTPNPDLAGARDEPHDWEKSQGASLEDKDDEYIVHWGDGQFTCNVYVYDVLYVAGENPSLESNDHYPDAGACHEGAGGYLTRISRSEIQPGDLFTNGVHMEIITSVSNGGQSFGSHGAHKDGAYEMDPSRYASADDLRFWRV